MKLALTHRYIASIAAALLGLSALTLNAQAPAGGRAAAGAAPAAGAPAAAAPARGGRGPAAPALPILQQLAIAQIQSQVSSDAVAAQAAALQALNEAPFKLPANPANLQQLATALGNAELNLAAARSEAVQKVQASLTKLTPEQISAGMAGGRGGAAGIAAAAAFKDSEGFVSIFNGRDLTGWNGESNVWSVTAAPAAAGGAMSIHSDNVDRSMGQHHIHFVGLPGVSPIIKDFELKVEFHIQGGNGGIHTRSRLLQGSRRKDSEPPLTAAGLRDHAAAIADPLGKRFPDNISTLQQAQDAGLIPGGGNANPWQISGYQLDITGANTASLYEGQGRGVVANTGEMIILQNPAFPDGVAPENRTIVAQTSDITYAQYGRPDGWNEAWVVARGNVLIYILNGRVFTIGVDDDVSKRALQGIISLQLEGTGKIWYRSVRLKHL